MPTNRSTAALLSALLLLPLSAHAEPPNFVLILADDLGIEHLARIDTPAIDRLAAEGMTFTAAYAGSALCAPSRAALLLGNHTGQVEPRGNRNMRLNGDPTLASSLQQAGYATGLFGKWGFGYQDDPTTWPERHGWDEYLAYLHHRDAHDHTPPLLWQDGARRDLSGEYAQDLFDAAALDFIERHAEQPFLLYAASALPHVPLEVPGVEGSDAEIFAAMVQRLDATVGAITGKLDELGLLERTLILVTSDNGAVDTARLRGQKGTLYEGGLRVPMIASWPGTIEPGETDHLVAGWDIYATAAGLAGMDRPPAGQPLLHSTANGRALYWELHNVTTAQAVRWDRWKALRHAPNEPVELYDLLADPGETSDLASGYPDEVAYALAMMTEGHVEHADWPMIERSVWTDLTWLKIWARGTVREWSGY